MIKISYFDRKASEYNLKRNKGLFGKYIEGIKKNVLDFLRPKEGDCILDAGCGAGDYSIILKNKGVDVLGVDVSCNMVEVAKKNGINAQVQDLENLKLNKNFDKVLCVGVLEFVNDVEKVIKNLSDCLKEGGSLVVVGPRVSFFGYLYKLFHLSHKTKIILFDLNVIGNLLEKNGFRLEKLKKIAVFCFIAKAVKI